MAKKIKFNLICDDKPIRTIEDLQNNFSVEDILAYYENKLLHRWLKVRGYEEELEKVSALACEQPLEIIKGLSEIFRVDVDEEQAEESIYILKYLDERKKLYAAYEKENYQVKCIVEDYESGYRHLVQEILDHPDNAAIIKVNIAEIASNYAIMLEYDHRNLFYLLKSRSPLAVMRLLMNGQTRNYYLPGEGRVAVSADNEQVFTLLGQMKNVTRTYASKADQDKEEMYRCICSMVRSNDFKERLGKYLRVFDGDTNSHWKEIEPKGKKYMIISLGSSDFVRSAGESGGGLDSIKINEKFIILDGIDHKCSPAFHQLTYMEV